MRPAIICMHRLLKTHTFQFYILSSILESLCSSFSPGVPQKDETMPRKLSFQRAVFSLLLFAFVANFWGILPSFLEVTVNKQVDEYGGNVLNVPELPRTSHNATRTVTFIPSNQLGKLDYFSATWLQPIDTFLKLQTEAIDNVEMGVFRVWKENPDKMKMTLDWLDFAVEHLSKYWKNVNVFSNDPVPYNFITKTLERYIDRADIQTMPAPLHTTIAVIAFQPYGSRNEERHLTVVSLAATMASMMQVGFGRILVVGYEEMDASFATETFQLLHNQTMTTTRNANANQSTITQIGGTEVSYVNVTLEEVTSRITPINRVKGALVGLQKALKGEMNDTRQTKWLGTTHDASYWNYVYLTEPDTILVTRPSSLSQIKAVLDSGFILAPHRLQPLPHEYDLKGMRNENKFLPASNFTTVIELPQDGVCCDALEGSARPFQKHKRCGSFWWQCGFNARRDHSRLADYELIRLSAGGTGIVNLAGTEHGRRCFPSTSGVCKLSS